MLSRRTRQVRFNDLIDPEPILLDADFAGIVVSDIPIVVLFARTPAGPITPWQPRSRSLATDPAGHLA